jgi:hypothetical protein
VGIFALRGSFADAGLGFAAGCADQCVVLQGRGRKDWVSCEVRGIDGDGSRGLGGLGWEWVLGELLDHVAYSLEADAAGVFYGDEEGFEDEVGAAQVDGVAGEGVDDFHEGSLNGLLVLDEGDGMQA